MNSQQTTRPARLLPGVRGRPGRVAGRCNCLPRGPWRWRHPRELGAAEVRRGGPSAISPSNWRRLLSGGGGGGTGRGAVGRGRLIVGASRGGGFRGGLIAAPLRLLASSACFTGASLRFSNQTIRPRLQPAFGPAPSAHLVGRHVLDVTEKLPGVTEKVLNVTQKLLNVTQKLPSVTAKLLIVTQHLLGVIPKLLIVTEKLRSVTEKLLGVAQHLRNVTEKLLDAVEKVRDVAE